MAAAVSLATWNVFQGLHHAAGPRAWVTNDDLSAKIQSLDADVLVLQELWQFRRPAVALAETLAQDLGYELHQWISDQPSRSTESVVWRIVVLTRVPARTMDAMPMPRLGPFGQRAVVRVHLTDLDVTLAGIHLYGIHLLLRRSPRDWLRERRLLSEVARDHDIVAGDMNMWSPIVRRDTPNLRAAVKGRTFKSSRPHSQIDHILVSDRIEVLGAERMPDMGSDHRALRVRLRTVQA